MNQFEHAFEIDLLTDSDLLNLVQDETFAKNLYASLCNVQWVKTAELYGASFRHVAALVAHLRNRGETYLDFYMSGAEGHIFPEIREKLQSLGWSPKYYDE